MSPFEVWSVILGVLTTVLTALTLWIAFWGLTTWRKEHVGKRKLELMERIYPHVKRLETNIPLIFRAETTDYEFDCIKRDLKSAPLPDQNYDAMYFIDYRMQNTFYRDFKTLQELSYFADIFLSEELRKIYYAIAELNLYFPIDYHSKGEEDISRYRDALKERVGELSMHLKNEISKGA